MRKIASIPPSPVHRSTSGHPPPLCPPERRFPPVSAAGLRHLRAPSATSPPLLRPPSSQPSFPNLRRPTTIIHSSGKLPTPARPSAAASFRPLPPWNPPQASDPVLADRRPSPHEARSFLRRPSATCSHSRQPWPSSLFHRSHHRTTTFQRLPPLRRHPKLPSQITDSSTSISIPAATSFRDLRRRSHLPDFLFLHPRRCLSHGLQPCFHPPSAAIRRRTTDQSPSSSVSAPIIILIICAAGLRHLRSPITTQAPPSAASSQLPTTSSSPQTL